ncbi:MAG: amidohydrolase [Clostridium sp.]|nr:amidohydrolase [Clostridium sp.]MDU7085082.1 amidohydrolase [Clostridium sp.]
MDIIFYNGIIKTMNLKQPTAQAIAIKNNIIYKVGTNEEVLALKNEDTEVVDLKGKLVFPGFNDSHLHLLHFGLLLQNLDLANTTSISSVIEKAKQFIEDKQLKEEQWVMGFGWNQDYFTDEKRIITRHDLDKVSTTHPIFLHRACGHIAVVNTKALEICNIDENTPQVEGGYFEVDENGYPTGVFRENAIKLINKRISKLSNDEIKECIMDAVNYANSKGITSCQTDDFLSLPENHFEDVIKAYNDLIEENKLTVRIYEQCLRPSKDLLMEFLDAGHRTGEGNEFFKIGPLKLLVDGSLGARTALLSEPYLDDNTTTGLTVIPKEQLDELIEIAHKNGMQIAVHCIGDKAMYMVFDGYEKVLKRYPKENHRHGIVHCQITDEALLKKYCDLNVLAYIQPVFFNSDIHIVEDKVGFHRAKASYRWKTMVDTDVKVSLGTDCPVELLDALPNIYSAVTRKDLKGYPENGWFPEERLSIDESIYAYTMGSAYASFEENIKGSIEENKLADFVVLEENIYEVPEDHIKDVQVNTTVVNGKIVYKNNI